VSAPHLQVVSMEEAMAVLVLDTVAEEQLTVNCSKYVINFSKLLFLYSSGGWCCFIR
jgi:hypothetical protein